MSDKYIPPHEFINGMMVEIKIGKHEGEVGVVIGKSSDHIQVLTLEGDTHYYEIWEISVMGVGGIGGNGKEGI